MCLLEVCLSFVLISVNCLIFISTLRMVGLLHMVFNQISNENFEKFTVLLLLSLEGKFSVNLINHNFEWFQSVEQNHFVVRNIHISLMFGTLLFVLSRRANLQHEEEPFEVVEHKFNL